jgi:hypothetical protein
MRDPRRMMCATILGLQCIVLGLSTPVLITVEDVDKSVALWIGLGLAVGAVVLAGLLRFEWAYYAGFALQVATLALGFVIPAMFVLGAIFGALWTTAYLLGKKIEADRAAWSA